MCQRQTGLGNELRYSNLARPRGTQAAVAVGLVIVWKDRINSPSGVRVPGGSRMGTLVTVITSTDVFEAENGTTADALLEARKWVVKRQQFVTYALTAPKFVSM